MPVMSVRPAAEGDMPAVRQVARHFGLLDGWPDGGDFLDAERRHGTLLVASAASGQAAGFGGTLRRGDVTHLGDLFVLPGHQSSGVGRALLARLLGGAGPRVTFASSDPRAVALYARSGLRPWCPLLYLTGGPLEVPPGPPVRTVGPDEVASLDAAVSGGARTETLTWYAAIPGVTVHATDAGYAFARLSGDRLTVGPAGGITPQDCAQAVLATLTAAAPPAAQVAVPGTHPLVPVLLGAGWRIADMDTFMADEAALAVLRPDRYIPHPDLG
ncbi:GNAT family N-acetyltransferase [Nonomuraea sp. NPDC049695]|uniref:GNAT family N-acetyltransferase n=1 Tax=Nonomuraea sp. NPDC049695 TaxID=3154734 RepID=UPI0034408B7B